MATGWPFLHLLFCVKSPLHSTFLANAMCNKRCHAVRRVNNMLLSGLSTNKRKPIHNGSQTGLGCHCLLVFFFIFIIFSPFDCVLATFPCLHPSIISSSVSLTAELLPLLILFHCDFSQASSPSPLLPPSPLCLFAVPLTWREWKLATDQWWPAANVHDRPLRSAAPTPGMRRAENDLHCIFGTDFPIHTQPIAVYPKHIEQWFFPPA